MNCIKETRLSILLITIIFSLAIIAQGHAATEVGGTISESVTWGIDGSPYLATSNVTVTGQNVILTIVANVTVLFNEGRYIWIKNGGGLVVQGTEENPVTFKSSTDGVFWSGIEFDSDSNHQASIIEHCIIDAADVGLDLDGASPTIDYCTFQNCNYGIDIDDNAQPIITNNLFQGNIKQPIRAYPNSVGSIGVGNRFENNGISEILVHGGSIPRDVTWLNHGIPYHAEGNITVQGSAKPILTLNPGVELRFDQGHYLWFKNGGGLQAVGTLENPVTFTTNLSGVFWSDIEFDSDSNHQASIIEHCIIDAADVGLDLNGASPTINLCTFQNCKNGMDIDNAQPTVTNNLFKGNLNQPILSDVESVGSIGVGNRFENNGISEILVRAGSISQDVTWLNHGIPYHAAGNITVQGGAKPILTLNPGVELRFDQSRYLWLKNGGGLQAIGTQENPVTFTTNLSGVYWSGLDFASDSNASESQIEYCIFRGAEPAVDLHSVSIDLNNCTFSENVIGAEISGSPNIRDSVFTQNAVGILVNGNEQPVIRNSTIAENTAFGIKVTTSSGSADARDNWWGHESGPLDDSDDSAAGGDYNPDGQGDRVTDKVIYRDWLGSRPVSAPPTITVLTPASGGAQTDNTFIIRWEDGDADDNALVSLYYDVNPEGFGGTLIVENLRENEPCDVYPWDTSNLLEGDYYIYGVIDDGNNPPVRDYAEDVLTIIHAKGIPGDVSGDGTLSAYDAVLILQYVVGIITQFPAGSLSPTGKVVPKDYTVAIPRFRVAPGERARVPVIVEDALGLLAGGIVVKYDTSVLRAVDVTPSSLLSGYFWKHHFTDDQVRMAFAGVQPLQRGGKIFYIEFEVVGGFEGDEIPLILESVDFVGGLTITKRHGGIEILPKETVLLPNYPNPFNPETWLPYRLSQDATVRISIYNTKGQLVRVLGVGQQSAGSYVAQSKAAYWDGKDNLGQKVTSGVYFYTLQVNYAIPSIGAGEFRATRKMVIVK